MSFQASNSTASVSRSIDEPLAGDILQKALGAGFVIYVTANSVVVAEIKFGQIPMHMLFAAVLVDERASG